MSYRIRNLAGNEGRSGRGFGGELQSELNQLIREYPYRDYRRHRSVTGGADRKNLLASLLEDRENGAECFGCYGRDGLAGVGVLSSLDWESGFFSTPMASLRLIVGPRNQTEVADCLLTEFGRVLSAGAIRHVSMRVDCEDATLLRGATRFGFRVMDSICTYEHHRKYPGFPDKIDHKYEVRLFKEEDREEVIAIAETCFADYPNRLKIDSHLPGEARARFFAEWAANCCSGEMAEKLLVARLRSRVVGFLAWRRNPGLLRRTGTVLHGNGLGGCVPIRFNAYYELLWAAMKEIAPEGADFDTHLFNCATINNYASLGFRMVRAFHTLRYWRDP